MPFAENLAVFTNPNEFGTAATYHPQGGGNVAVNGVFDNADTELGVGSVGVEGNPARFWCRSADIPNPQYGETIDIGAVTYTLQSFQNDGLGAVTLILKEP